jgi:hypothetical protein
MFSRRWKTYGYLLKDNNIVDHFPEKVICGYIVEAVYPVELRKRVK